MLAKFSEHNSNFTKFYGKYIQSSGWESNLQGECPPVSHPGDFMGMVRLMKGKS